MTKRTSDQFMQTNPYEDEFEVLGYEGDAPVVVVDDCDTVRRKIRALIDNGEMKVGEFQKAIDVLPTTYSRFMSQNGKTKGEQSSVYLAAWKFFKQREMMGIKTVPNKKVKKAGEGDGPPPVDDVELEGETEDKVPVYDTCDDVRRKINAHLKKPGVTQASFLRAASASFHTTEKKLAARSLSTFRSKHGAYEGNIDHWHYDAYARTVLNGQTFG
ncbi:hypothetical protein TUN199_01394 [Pyrenophora tritici-repentis]|uniref:DUF7726 domain-containing protein n=1 Tax=Pyrenophora tritici-repentis TaxID=45151 RepID=A0A2W1HJA9_9PLEO|nr:hypothetical protein A1F99_002610 [Pyrenophora tritici-repentis]KAF7576050.1 hypothetical protein PtrM4_002900 [Pyrenophora tritici-repentis]KAI0626556.1 hypothetical protein TUN199_01394 [Pyrenophora tritici-repentis]KAI1529117.1 hypothetical protein PtrSN001C_009184 [Pyrenophora tritici-repentis]PWO21403.1 DUF1741 domain containing protein [Pyrenophora tritici-repentis]